jgi:type VI secretion system protein ImpG
MRDDLLLYYERELDYLRKMAVQFAEKHPKVASRLVLEPTKCEDPHVERLLEAFAFLAARVHLKVDDEFPEITESLLTVIYPQLVRPVPSMSIVQFQLDPEKGKLATGLPIKRDSVLYSRPVNGVPCTFRTCYDTVLWPITVTAAEWTTPGRLQPAIRSSEASYAIRLELQCAPDAALPRLKVDRLRFFLDGEIGFINTLYELLLSRCTRILVRDPNPKSKSPPVPLPASALQPVGFGPREGMVPFDRRAFLGHRLLLEYFTFADKFLFVEVSGLESIWSSGFKESAELVFLISDLPSERHQRLESELSSRTFRLGCSPIVNLFPQVAEPVQLNQTKYEYPIVPDVRRPFATEVFSVDTVACINTANQQTTTFEPFYSLRHAVKGSKEACFWLARRRPATRPNDSGTDMFLSLVDLSMRTVQPEGNVLSVATTCTNRDLPARLTFGSDAGDFEMEGGAPLKRIVALRKPTAAVRPPGGRSALWRLLSHLSLNHLSLVEEGKEALQQILRLYDYGRSSYSQGIVDSILRVQSRRHFAGVASEDGISFARGTRIHLELDEERFAGGGAFLFASVLEQFLGISVSLNSFTQLIVTTPQRKDPLHEWQPRAGRRILV